MKDITLEHNEDEFDHQFCCKKSVAFQNMNETQTIFAIHEAKAEKYADQN